MSASSNRVTRILLFAICLISSIAMCEMVWSRMKYHSIRSKIIGLIPPLAPPGWFIAIIPVLCIAGILIGHAQAAKRSTIGWHVSTLVAVAALWCFHAYATHSQTFMLQL